MPTPSTKIVKVRPEPLSDGVQLFKLQSGEAVFYTADMDVDADGCPLAYHPKDTGIEALANATSKKTGKLSPAVIVYKNGTPVVQGTGDPAPGYYVSQTALRSARAAKHPEDPTCYLDALTVPYIVIPSGAMGGAKPGNPALVINRKTNTRVKAIVGDVGGPDETGEVSMYCSGLARELTAAQITEKLARTKHSVINPRDGGDSLHRYRYIIFTGIRLTWPQTNTQIEAAVDAAMKALTPDQLLAVTL